MGGGEASEETWQHALRWRGLHLRYEEALTSRNFKQPQATLSSLKRENLRSDCNCIHTSLSNGASNSEKTPANSLLEMYLLVKSQAF